MTAMFAEVQKSLDKLHTRLDGLDHRLQNTAIAMSDVSASVDVTSANVNALVNDVGLMRVSS